MGLFRNSIVPTVCLLTVGLGQTALAQTRHRYVDKNSGNNNYDGTAPDRAWRDLTSAVNRFPSGSDVTIHVAEGVYNQSNGETFPILMRGLVRIHGDNALATYIDGSAGGESGFLFCHEPVCGLHGPFGPADGVYLRNLTIRDFDGGGRKGIQMYGLNGYPGGTSVSPTFVNLFVYRNYYGMRCEIASPMVFDCTVTENTEHGLSKFVGVAEDCSIWTVRNSIVWGNLNRDLYNISQPELTYCDFDPIKAEISTAGQFRCMFTQPSTSEPPAASDNFNVNRDPLFVNPQPAAPDVHDLRLNLNPVAGIGVRDAGIDTTPIHGVREDGEGLGNPRVLPYPIYFAGVCMGADQIDLLQLKPLVMWSVGANPRIGVDTARFSMEMAGYPRDFVFPVVHNNRRPLPALPISIPGVAGFLWTDQMGIAPIAALLFPVGQVGFSGEPFILPVRLFRTYGRAVFQSLHLNLAGGVDLRFSNLQNLYIPAL